MGKFDISYAADCQYQIERKTGSILNNSENSNNLIRNKSLSPTRTFIHQVGKIINKKGV
jgi:hypothetical protein